MNPGDVSTHPMDTPAMAPSQAPGRYLWLLEWRPGHVHFETRNLHPAPCEWAGTGRRVVVWGHPLVGGRLDAEAAARALAESEDLASAAARLDGSFVAVVLDGDDHALTLVNDRLGSLPFFWHWDGERLLAATSLVEVRRRLVSGADTVDADAVFQFLYFRRLFGAASYDRRVRFLQSASLLTLAGQGTDPKHAHYWAPRFDKSTATAQEFAEELAMRLRTATEACLSDTARPALFLSGGLDSRALLAAAPGIPLCLTNSPRPNNEVEIARELAAIADSEHAYLQRPERFLDGVVDDSVYLSGGMTVYTEAQFSGYGPQVAPRADALLIGLALDVFFCGHYLPKHLATWLGRSGLHFVMEPLESLPVDRFLARISYRLKTSDPWTLVRSEHRPRLREYLRQVIEPSMRFAQERGADPYDQWEYTHLHDLARHYSFQMAASVRPWAQCRVPAVHGGLYELALSMPLAYKFNWRVYQQAIARLSPRMMAVRNANTNISASASLQRQTWTRFARAASNRLLRTRFRTTPDWYDRSWPHPRQSIDVNPSIHARVLELPESEALAALPWLDMPAVSIMVDEHMRGVHDHTIALNVLLTIATALQG